MNSFLYVTHSKLLRMDQLISGWFCMSPCRADYTIILFRSNPSSLYTFLISQAWLGIDSEELSTEFGL